METNALNLSHETDSSHSTRINKQVVCCLFYVPGTLLIKRAAASLNVSASFRKDGHILSISSASCHLTPAKLNQCLKPEPRPSTAPTEIENLVLQSANDITVFPKWSTTVVKEEHNRGVITGGTLTSPFSCKTHKSALVFMDYPDAHAHINTPGR